MNEKKKELGIRARNKFICSGCGTKYSSPQTTPPPGIKWDDGHVCTPELVKDE